MQFSLRFAIYGALIPTLVSIVSARRLSSLPHLSRIRIGYIDVTSWACLFNQDKYMLEYMLRYHDILIIVAPSVVPVLNEYPRHH